MASFNFHTMRLTYFDGNGRADPIRLALRISEIPFEDERIQLRDWMGMRDSGDRDLPLCQLPTLTVNTTVYCQSMAQLRFVGRLSGLYPTDPLAQLCVDEIVDTCQEVLNRAPNAHDMNAKRALRESYAAKHMSKAFKFINCRLASSMAEYGKTTCCCGTDLSIADLTLYALCRLITLGEFDHVSPAFVDATRFPALAAVLQTIQQHPKMQKLAGDFLLTTSKIVENRRNNEFTSECSTAKTCINRKDANQINSDKIDTSVSAADSIIETRATAPSTMYRTWADDTALGKKCPSLESLEYIHQQKHAPAPNACAHRVIVFWASYADGDFGVLHDVSALCSKPCFESVQPVGISCDSLRDNAESFLPLIGTPVADLKISALSVDIPLAFDVAKSFRSALRATTGLLAVGVSMVFIVDKNDTIVWREQFSQTHAVGDGQLADQLQRLVDGQPLLSNGPRPTATEDDASEEENGTDVDSADSDGLML
eukprot:m.221412 g.221412  ORF g.221412 m.221412 type:complete len:484 (+) comp19188_c0_seq3:291-1742(+)